MGKTDRSFVFAAHECPHRDHHRTDDFCHGAGRDRRRRTSKLRRASARLVIRSAHQEG